MSRPFESCAAWNRPNVVLVDSETLRKAQLQISSCEACAPTNAKVLFDEILDDLTGCDPSSTDYEFAKAVPCPCCGLELDSGVWVWFSTDAHSGTLFIRPGTLVTVRGIRLDQ